MTKKIQRSSMVQTDEKGKVTREAKSDASGEAINFQWWLTEGNDEQLAQQIAGTIKFIDDHEGDHKDRLLMGTRLYGNSYANNRLIGSTRPSSNNQAPMQRIGYNLCAAVIDTLTSKVAKNRVVPMFLTQGGSWKMQKKAKQLSKFVDGLFYQNQVHEKGTYCFRDAGAWGKGFVHPYVDDDGEICLERVLPHEIKVDRIEAINGDPRQLHRVRTSDRYVLAAAFPNKKDAIMKAKAISYEDMGNAPSSADLLTVTESYRLPSSKKAKDGKKVICVGDTVLYNEEWNKMYFPFPSISYSKDLVGWDSQGACDRLRNLQLEINKLMILVQRSMWMGGSFKVLLENGSKVVSQHLNNDVGSIIHYTGTPPQYITPPMIQQEIYPYIDSLIQKGFQQEGVSEMSATSKMPAQELSGRALRSLNDMESERFLFLQQQIETFYLEVGMQFIDLARDIYKDKKEFKVTFPGTKFIETIDWKDIKLEDEEFEIKAYPTSQLPEDPAGRFQTIQEWAQAGFISPRTAKRLMDMPDIEMEESLSNAAEDYIHKGIEQMLDTGEMFVLEQFNDLVLAKQLALQYYNYAQYLGIEEEKLDLIRQLLSQIGDLDGSTAAAMQAQAAGPMPQGTGAPMAAPEATPTSPLIQNQGVQ